MNDEHQGQEESEVLVKKKKEGVPRKKILFWIVGVVFVFGFVTAQVYTRPVTDGFVRTVVRVVPYPALSIGGERISIAEFLAEYDALTQYFGAIEGAPVPASDELGEAIVQTLTNKMVISQLAQEYGVETDDDRVELYYQDIVLGQESEEVFVTELQQTFGWTTTEFRQRIVEPIVLALSMEEALQANEDLQQERANLSQEAWLRVNNGELFEVVSKDVHSGFVGLQSDLGYVDVELLPESWRPQVEVLVAGEVTSVIDLPEGFAFFQLVDRLASDDASQVHLMMIMIPKIGLEEFVDDRIQELEIKNYIHT